MSNSLRPHGLYTSWNSPRHLPNPGIEPMSPALQVDSLPAEPQGKPNKMDTQEEIDRFLEKFNLARLKQEEIEIMNKPIINNEIEL